MVRKKRDEVEEAVESVMEEIDAHDLSGGEVPMSTTLAFLQGIQAELQTRIQAIKEDMKNIAEGADDDDGAEGDSDEG